MKQCCVVVHLVLYLNLEVSNISIDVTRCPVGKGQNEKIKCSVSFLDFPIIYIHFLK